MSEQEITLGQSTDSNYQLHSLRVYKTPVLPTDAVNLLYSGQGGPIKPFYCATTVYLQSSADDYPGYLITSGDYPAGFPVADWECAMVGFQNSDVKNTYIAWPNVSGGKWYVYYRRTGNATPDKLNMLMVRKQFIIT
jgi:hypothetical protein